MTALQVPRHDVDDLVDEARATIKASGLPALLCELAPGPYGASEGQLRLLAALEHGLAVVLAVRRALEGRIGADRRSGLAAGELSPVEGRFCSLLASAVGLQEALAGLALEAGELPAAERHLRLGEYRALLTAAEQPLLAGLAADLCGYLRFYGGHAVSRLRPADDPRLLRCAGSYLALVARTAARLGDDGEHAATLEGLREVGLDVGGVCYRGFARERVELAGGDDSALLDVWPDDIVGNQEVLAAGIKLCRAVAGFDLARHENPQQVRNPVIFVLGSPGCGKTVTAHAIGNFFLDLCRRNSVPARFRIIRRTDWASHYQNRSASELLRIFRDEIFAFPGVAGAYWPDIDTAFAAREDPGVRGEDKALLGTLFGLLDGTIGPRNGKWFLLADANFLSMDEAMLSRLAQDPYHARGPQTAGDFVELLRDKKLRRVAAHLELDDAAWHEIGQRFVDAGLSGRAADNIAGKLLTIVEDVELPDEYFALGFDDKRRMIEQRRRNVDLTRLRELVERYVRFEKEAEDRARQERFERRVTEIRERLAAQVVAVGGGGSDG